MVGGEGIGRRAVEMLGRLVEDHERPSGDQQAGERDALPLPARDRRRRRTRPWWPCRRAGWSTQSVSCAASSAPPTSSSVAVGSADADVVGDRWCRRCAPAASACRRAGAGRRRRRRAPPLPRQPHRPGVRQEAHQHVGERRLARRRSGRPPPRAVPGRRRGRCPRSPRLRPSSARWPHVTRQPGEAVGDRRRATPAAGTGVGAVSTSWMRTAEPRRRW